MACPEGTVARVGCVLNDQKKPLPDRFRALFTLRGIGGDEAIGQIARCLKDPSALLKHECAYCLGQMQDTAAIPVLRAVLQNRSQEDMVRHEAAEALGAIGDLSQKEILGRYSTDSAAVVAETCQVALARVSWLADKDGGHFEDNNPYMSVDPSPPVCEGGVGEWKGMLTDQSLPLFQRYRALFSLRNHGGEEAVAAISSALTDNNALFKHELAYVLGQMQSPLAIPSLTERLTDRSEHPMVRHECAEALGAIASEECISVLQQFLMDKEPVVRESCEVALDMFHYEHAQDFQYANTAVLLTH